MDSKKIKIIVTLGPSTNKESDLWKLKDKGVDFVRINMSHSSIDDLRNFIALSKKVGIPFILDTEGSQIRSGFIANGSMSLEEGDEVKIHAKDILGDEHNLSLRPSHVVSELQEGDLLYMDFGSLILLVSDTAAISKGHITAKVLTGGNLGSNKAVVVDSALPKDFHLPSLSDKDYQSIELGLQENIGYMAASFVRSGDFVNLVREATKHSMKIISKIECVDALKNLDEIIEKSDFILIDRGDLSKEIPIEKIPFAQKIILAHARDGNKEVFVATNLLETMIEKPRPTRAEVHDVIATVLDGASGVALSAETAIGKYPMECVAMMNKLLNQAGLISAERHSEKADTEFVEHLERSNYLFDQEMASTLIPPHGGKLISRVLGKAAEKAYVASLQKIRLEPDLQMDVLQIATGVFSPLEGFMEKKDLQGVLDNMRLDNGIIWPIPVVLDVSAEVADGLFTGEDIVLADNGGEAIALLHLEEKYTFDKDEYAKKLYGTLDQNHPGVKKAMMMHPVFLGGKVDLLKRPGVEFGHYALTPRQIRRLFAERHWSRVVGFHTRNVIHRSHEYIQLKALEDASCDGLFVHPVVGKKKPGDYHASCIIKSYERMMYEFYPQNKVVFATFNTYSRYAGPREAVFTAICRQNFGCSHFVVGRDHAGVGSFYPPDASHKIFDLFPDLRITPVKFGDVFYSKKLGRYIHEKDSPGHNEEDKMRLSGTEARKIFENGLTPLEWFMRPEIAEIIADARNKGEDIFVKAEKAGAVIWFTGLSGSGKSTVALKLKEVLESRRKSVTVIDGDDIRKDRHKHLGFSRDDIRENNLLVAELARKKAQEFDFVLVPIISPYQEDRVKARSIIGAGFVELFVNAPVEKCIERDPKGLYKKALAGEIPDFIGLSETNPYEVPDSPDMEIKSDTLSAEQSVDKVLLFLQEKDVL